MRVLSSVYVARKIERRRHAKSARQTLPSPASCSTLRIRTGCQMNLNLNLGLVSCLSGWLKWCLLFLNKTKKTPSRKRLIECVNCVRVFKRALGLWKIAKKTESVTLATDRRPVGGRWQVESGRSWRFPMTHVCVSLELLLNFFRALSQRVN